MVGQQVSALASLEEEEEEEGEGSGMANECRRQTKRRPLSWTAAHARLGSGAPRAGLARTTAKRKWRDEAVDWGDKRIGGGGGDYCLPSARRGQSRCIDLSSRKPTRRLACACTMWVWLFGLVCNVGLFKGATDKWTKQTGSDPVCQSMQVCRRGAVRPAASQSVAFTSLD